MFGLSALEIGVILLVILIVFGPKQLPKMARRLGKALGELRHAGNELKDSLTEDLELESRRAKKSQETVESKPSVPPAQEPQTVAPAAPSPVTSPSTTTPSDRDEADQASALSSSQTSAPASEPVNHATPSDS